jgi:hypothetical protein
MAYALYTNEPAAPRKIEMVLDHHLAGKTLKAYTVADVQDVTASTEPSYVIRLAIVVKTDGDAAWITWVRHDGDHGGLMHRVNASALRNVRTMDLLA